MLEGEVVIVRVLDRPLDAAGSDVGSLVSVSVLLVLRMDADLYLVLVADAVGRGQHPVRRDQRAAAEVPAGRVLHRGQERMRPRRRNGLTAHDARRRPTLEALGSGTKGDLLALRFAHALSTDCLSLACSKLRASGKRVAMRDSASRSRAREGGYENLLHHHNTASGWKDPVVVERLCAKECQGAPRNLAASARLFWEANQGLRKPSRIGTVACIPGDGGSETSPSTAAPARGTHSASRTPSNQA